MNLKSSVQMKAVFGQKNVLLKICIAKFELVRNILADVGSGKRQESIGDAQIFWIFGHQQPCRYGEKIYIYKIRDKYLLCVVCPLQEGFSVVKFRQSRFFKLFDHNSVIFGSFTYSKFFFRHHCLMTLISEFLSLKVLHQQEFYLVRTKWFDEMLTHKWKYLPKKWSKRCLILPRLTLGRWRWIHQYATEYLLDPFFSRLFGCFAMQISKRFGLFEKRKRKEEKKKKWKEKWNEEGGGGNEEKKEMKRLLRGKWKYMRLARSRFFIIF